MEVNGTQSTFGEFSDLWRGSYKGENVSVKAFRVNKNNTENVEQLKKASLELFTKRWCERDR